MQNYIIIDKYTISRESIAALIYESEDDCLVYETAAIDEAISTIKLNTSIKFIIYNPNCNLDDAFDSIRELKKINPSVKLLVISYNTNQENLDNFLRHGADVTVAVNSSRNKMRCAIRSLKIGGSFTINSTQSTKSNSAICSLASKPNNARKASRPCLNYKLTARQKDVLSYMTKGYANKLIAYELGVSEGTVKLHVSSILRALNVKNRTEAALTAGLELNLHAH